MRTQNPQAIPSGFGVYFYFFPWSETDRGGAAPAPRSLDACNDHSEPFPDSRRETLRSKKAVTF